MSRSSLVSDRAEACAQVCAPPRTQFRKVNKALIFCRVKGLRAYRAEVLCQLTTSTTLLTVCSCRYSQKSAASLTTSQLSQSASSALNEPLIWRHVAVAVDVF